MRARNRLGKLLLRYEGTRDRWTDRHRAWLARVELPERGAHATFLDYLGAITALEIRRETLETTIAELAPASRWAGDIARLRCLRGIDTLSAVGLCAEVGDFARFERPAQLMSYLGLVPSERSTGEARRQGAITKSGSGLARWLLIEAAWHYRHTHGGDQARPPSAGSRPSGNRALVEDPAAALLALATTRSQARQASPTRRRRDRAPDGQILLGDRHARPTHDDGRRDGQ